MQGAWANVLVISIVSRRTDSILAFLDLFICTICLRLNLQLAGVQAKAVAAGKKMEHTGFVLTSPGDACSVDGEHVLVTISTPKLLQDYARLSSNTASDGTYKVFWLYV